MIKYKIVKITNKNEELLIESNIDESELFNYVRKYLQFREFMDWYDNERDIPLEYDTLTIEDLEDNMNDCIQSLVNNAVVWDIEIYLGNHYFVKKYEQNVRVFVSLEDYGDLSPVCAKPDGEHKLIILDNAVVHSGVTEKPVGTVNYGVEVNDFSFDSFKFCGEVVISEAQYLNCLAKDKSLADIMLEHFNGKAPFDIEFAEKEEE